MGVALSGGDMQYTSLLLNPPSLSSWIVNEFSSPLLSQSRGAPLIRDTGTCPLLGRGGPYKFMGTEERERKKGFGLFFVGARRKRRRLHVVRRETPIAIQ